MSRESLETKTRILNATWQLMEQQPGKSVSMSAIAKATGISRQAIYLHYASRTELIIATSQYVDEIKGLNERLSQLQKAGNATELLEACVDVWGNYIPEIFGIAKAMLMTRETDEATAAAWNNNMQCLHDVFESVIDALEKEKVLTEEWQKKEAVELMSTILSINNWEQLTKECGWSQAQYIERIKTLLKRSLIT